MCFCVFWCLHLYHHFITGWLLKTCGQLMTGLHSGQSAHLHSSTGSKLLDYLWHSVVSSPQASFWLMHNITNQVENPQHVIQVLYSFLLVVCNFIDLHRGQCCDITVIKKPTAETWWGSIEKVGENMSTSNKMQVCYLRAVNQLSCPGEYTQRDILALIDMFWVQWILLVTKYCMYTP